jgi:TonB family protein
MLICSSMAAARPYSGAASITSGPELYRVFFLSPPPLYPYEARRNHWSGRGVYRAFVTPEGKVSQVTILHSSGHFVLDDLVIRWALYWRAKPGRPKEVDFPMVFVAPLRTPGEY